MLPALLVLLPVAAGAVVWAGGVRLPEERRRWLLGVTAAATLVTVTGLAVAVALDQPRTSLALGPGWQLTIDVTPLAGVVAVLVPVVALPIVIYAAGHEELRGLGRLVGGLTAFVGPMELVVVAGDLLTLLIGWELVGALSYGLISHEWRDPDVPRRAAHAFNATRFGDLGLFLAAGAAMAGVGELGYRSMAGSEGTALHVLVAGVVLAAAAKSAQGPFAPWLFSAMAGPTPVSALLHSATMVAAGAYLLARLHPVLDLAPWFAPTVIGIGLATALAGGVVATLQTHAKKLLAASTSAQYGLMLVAIGAGFPAAAGAHLVAHALLKSLLFLVAGLALAATGSSLLGRPRLGAHLRTVAGASLVGALALAAVPPLGAAWTKEALVAASGHHAPWLAVAVALAGGLTALYAARFQLLGFGRAEGDVQVLHVPERSARAAVVGLAVATLCLTVLFVPGSKPVVSELLGGGLPSVQPWELAVSLGLVAVGIWAAGLADRRGRLGSLGTAGVAAGAADWLWLPRVTERTVVSPSLRLATTAARFDDRIVDAGVRAAAAVGAWLSRTLSGRVEGRTDRLVEVAAAASQRLADTCARVAERVLDGVVEGTATGVGAAGRDARRLQSGLVHHYFVLIGVGLVGLIAVAAVWR